MYCTKPLDKTRKHRLTDRWRLHMKHRLIKLRARFEPEVCPNKSNRISQTWTRRPPSTRVPPCGRRDSPRSQGVSRTIMYVCTMYRMSYVQYVLCAVCIMCSMYYVQYVCFYVSMYAWHVRAYVLCVRCIYALRMHVCSYVCVYVRRMYVHIRDECMDSP